MQYNLVELMENMFFGGLVLEKRTFAKLTQQQLADEAGISKSYVSTIENQRPHSVTGAVSQPEKDVVIAIVEALNKHLSEADRIDLNSALLLAGYAPRDSKLVIPPNVIINAFDGVDENDIKEILEFIEFKKQRNNVIEFKKPE